MRELPFVYIGYDNAGYPFRNAQALPYQLVLSGFLFAMHLNYEIKRA